VADSQTGFSSTVFSKDGVNYFAIRGTDPSFFAGALDWLTNVKDVSWDGIAISQGIALFNYLQRLQGAAGEPNPLTVPALAARAPMIGAAIAAAPPAL